MKCTRIKTDGGEAIVCGNVRPRTCPCGRIASRLCDWKMGAGMTCDNPICDGCTTEPPGTNNKDLCKLHSKQWGRHPGNKQKELNL